MVTLERGDPAFLLMVRRIVAIAPHPDDESIGCGGLLALSAARDARIRVVVATDGGASHPNSGLWPRPRLACVRRAETVAALATLGIAETQATFLALRDGDAPSPGTAAWDQARGTLAAVLTCERPDVVLVPWRRDPHADHRAVAGLALECVRGLRPSPRVLEYPVWLDENGTAHDLPDPARYRCVAIDVRSVIPAKRAAIAAHLSQTTGLIHDDPDGFRLDPAFIERALRPEERYFEAIGP
ncbi:MAG: PIG-L deacetylase family protein [Alphaproteobacteria bacterium]